SINYPAQIQNGFTSNRSGKRGDARDEQDRARTRPCEVCRRLHLDSVRLEKSGDRQGGASVEWKSDSGISIGKSRHQETFSRRRAQAGGVGFVEREIKCDRNPRRFKRATRRANAQLAEREHSKIRARQPRFERASARQAIDDRRQIAAGKNSTPGADGEFSVGCSKDCERQKIG